LVKLLRREAELRKAAETLEDMLRAEESADSEWMNAVEDLQYHIVKEYRDRSNASSEEFVDITVQDLREAALRHPETAFWVKHNRARRGSLKVGDPAPDISLLRAVDGRSTALLAQPSIGRSSTPNLTVIVAGSLS